MLNEQQHAERATGIGSSDAAAVMGLNPYRSAVDVYLEKTGQVAPADLSDNDAVHWGNVLEDTVAQEYARRTGRRVRRRHQTFRHDSYPWMVCHPDRTVDNHATILECKTAGHYTADRWGESGSDDVPDEYLVQVTHQMIVMGYERADLAVLIGGRDFRIYHLSLDHELADMVIEAERAFWQEHVKAGLPPEPRDARDITTLYPADSGNAELASADAVEAYERLKTVRDEAKALAGEESDLKQRLQTELRDASALVDEQGRTLVTWKRASDSSRFDAKAFATAYPELHQQYQTTQAGSRRFLIK